MNNTVRFIVRVAIFGAIAGVLYAVPFLAFNIPPFPPFLKFHFDEIPILIAGFAYGPWSALACIFIRALIKLPFDIGETMGVGVLGDILFSTAFVLPAAFIYTYKRTISGALIGLGVGMVAQIIVAMVANVYLILPFYMFVLGFTREAILSVCPPAVTNLEWSYAFIVVLPFNAIKDAIVVLVTLLVYKPLRRLINQFEAKKENHEQ